MEEEKPWFVLRELKKQVSIEQVVTHYNYNHQITWNHYGQGRGLAPWREEKTPSFSLNRERNCWNDLAGRPTGPDGKPVAGDVVGLVQAFEASQTGQACDFHEAGRIMAEIAGIRGDTRKGVNTTVKGKSKEVVEAKTDKEKFKEPNITEANKPFGKVLRGLRAKNVPYYEEKGITEATIRAFGAGYCSRGYHKGRCVSKILRYDGEKHVVMGYSGRSTKEGDAPTHKLPVGFYKSLELFYHPSLYDDRRVQNIIKKSGLIVVEGFADVMRLWQLGFPNVTAVMGNSISEVQLDLMEKTGAKAIKLFFDNDGQAETYTNTVRSLHLLAQRFWVRVVNYDLVSQGEFVEFPSEPEHFTVGELELLLNQEPLIVA